MQELEELLDLSPPLGHDVADHLVGQHAQRVAPHSVLLQEASQTSPGYHCGLC